MIIRFVKMYFKPAEINTFKTIFFESSPLIKSFPGCLDVKLLQDKLNPTILSTLSHWNSIEDLEAYRKSNLFKTTWAKTKILFDAKPEANSFEQVKNEA
ncbi:MAG: antibiotic biosynthesis monooxygenase [Saprospiraceae bacterium]|nr:antibiotic biosynthesis monooxygenase [Saprospiraceae bacterium]MBK9720184.1 antibiotic biosynthesis monooxygenase [Saprospiraceae bacterium]